MGLKNKKFEDELACLLNKYSVDSDTGTPDFILAALVVDFLRAMGKCVSAREAWFGRSAEITFSHSESGTWYSNHD